MSSVKKLKILFFMVIVLGCAMQKEGHQDITQGIYGSVTWLEGNMMPSPDEPNLGKGRPVKRTILFYKAVNFDKVQGQAPLFSKINAELVKQVTSNDKGLFACEMPPGTYSVFTLEQNGMFFANSFDGNGLINAIKVEQGKATNLKIEINYRAAY